MLLAKIMFGIPILNRPRHLNDSAIWEWVTTLIPSRLHAKTHQNGLCWEVTSNPGLAFLVLMQNHSSSCTQ